MCFLFNIGFLFIFFLANMYTFTNDSKPSFHEAMSITPTYVAERAETKPLWRKIIELYDNVSFDHIRKSELKIPRIIHHIWLGSKFPQKCVDFRKSWYDKHPKWLHILWTDNSENFDDSSTFFIPLSFDELIDFLNNIKQYEGKRIVINIRQLAFSTRNQFIHSKNYGEQSDILRYEILFHCGGLYVDTDFKCLKSFNNLHHACDFYAGLNFEDENFAVFNGLIGARPHHPLCERCIEKISHQSVDRSYSNKVDIMHRTGPYFFSSIIREYIMHENDIDRVVLFPVTFLYPYPHLYRDNYRDHSTAELEKIWLKPESLAIHFWHVSWNPKKKGKNE